MINKITLVLLTFIFLYSCSSNNEKIPQEPLSHFDSKVFEVSTKNAIIVWDEAQDLNLDSTHYSIKLNNQTVASDLEGVTYTFTNLQPKTTYKGRIEAVDQSGHQSVASFTFKTTGNETINQASL